MTPISVTGQEFLLALWADRSMPVDAEAVHGCFYELLWFGDPGTLALLDPGLSYGPLWRLAQLGFDFDEPEEEDEDGDEGSYGPTCQ